MASLDMTAGLGTTLRGSELDQAYAGSKNSVGQRHGHGTYQFPNQFYRYAGDFVHGEAHGTGRLTMADGGDYEGDFSHDEITGSGERKWNSGKTFVGTFEDGEMHGQGTLTFPDGAKFVGQFNRNAREGVGKLIESDELSGYQGEWLGDKKHGKGVETVAVRYNERFEGTFLKGKREGHGKSVNDVGDTYEGDWAEGKKHGTGKLFDKASGVSYAGGFQNDDPTELPVLLDTDARGKPEEGEEEGPMVGTLEAPLSIVAGDALSANGNAVVLRARLPPVVPDPEELKEPNDAETTEATEDAPEEAAELSPEETSEDTPSDKPVQGAVAKHESGRVFRCVLTVGTPMVVTAETVDTSESGEAPSETPAEEKETAKESDTQGIDTPVTYAYGPEIPLAPSKLNPLSFDAAFTDSGAADLNHVTLPKSLEGGVYTLVVRDATPGWYGNLQRCPEKFVVMQVDAATEEPEEGAEAE